MLRADGTMRRTIVDLPGSSNGSVASTEGPDDAFNDLLPQVFFTFQGTFLTNDLPRHCFPVLRTDRARILVVLNV